MNIAFIHKGFQRGGTERVTMDIARYLPSKDYRIYVFTPSFKRELFPEDIERHLTIKIIPKGRFEKRKVVEELIRTLDIQIIVHLSKEYAGLKNLRQSTGVKTILANHFEPFWERHAIISRRQNTPFKRLLWKLYWHKIYQDDQGGKAMRMAIERTRKQYNNNDAYTVLCQSYKKEICDALGIDADTSHVVPIENCEYVRDNVYYEKDNIILYSGRLRRWDKRVDRLLRIWSMVQHQLPDWQLILVGDGNDSDNLKQMAAKSGLERISFEGVKSDVQPYYDRASILALTSQSEGWGLCLTEAQASGVIPIAFGCTSGVQEILSPEGIHGFTVTCFDEKEYARKLVHIANLSEEEKQRIRHAVVTYRAQYAPEIIVLKWKALFDQLVAGDNTSPLSTH